METPFSVICINARNKPNDIPTSKWVTEGKVYTVIEVRKLLVQNGALGYKLEEVSLDGCAPYDFYAAIRFGIILNPEVLLEIRANELLKEAVEEEKNEEIDSNPIKKTGPKEKMAK